MRIIVVGTLLYIRGILKFYKINIFVVVIIDIIERIIYIGKSLGYTM
jgi:hypothetical protein